MRRSVGVCSWSLGAADASELVARTRAAGLDAVQLALDPLDDPGDARGGRGDGPRGVETVRRTLEAGGVRVLSGMLATVGEDYSTLETIRRTGGIVPDEHWEENLARVRRAGRIARALELDLVSFHAGFLPEERSPRREVLLERLRAVADALAAEGVRVALETGQESAAALEAALADLDRPEVGVNFDPANLILYGSDEPLAALERLAPRILQFHVKDALPSAEAGAWGSEVRVGEGAVDWERFFELLAAHRIPGDLVIEREAGADRVEDIRAARRLVARLGGGA